MAAAAKEPKKQRVFGVKTFSFGSSTRSVGVAFVVVCSPHRPRFRRLLSKVPKASIQLKEEEKKGQIMCLVVRILHQAIRALTMHV